MAKNAITDFSTTAESNTDIGGISILGSAPVLNFDNALREFMSQLADTNAGTSPWADTMTIGNVSDLTRMGRFSMAGISTGTTRVYTMPNFDGTMVVSGGAATVDNTIPRHDGTAGKLQASGVTIDDSNNITPAAVHMATGSASVPTFAHSTNTDCGLFFTSLSGLAWTFNGTEYTRWTDTAAHLGKSSGDISTAGTSIYYGSSNGLVQVTRSGNICLEMNRLASDGTIVQLRRAGTSVGSISVTTTATAYNTSSDRNLKTNLRAFDAGAILDAIEVWQFDWKSGGSGYGVMAQDCAKVFPEAVTVGNDETPWQVDYSKFVPLLLAEIQELRRLVLAGRSGREGDGHGTANVVA